MMCEFGVVLKGRCHKDECGKLTRGSRTWESRPILLKNWGQYSLSPHSRASLYSTKARKDRSAIDVRGGPSSRKERGKDGATHIQDLE
jgi:hypothetical protein